MNNGHFAFITQEFIQADLNKEDKDLIQLVSFQILLYPLPQCF